MKKAMNIVLWMIFATGLMLVMGFVSRRQTGLSTSKESVRIHIHTDSASAFLTPENIKERVALGLEYDMDDVRLDALNLGDLESFIKGMSEVKDVEVYRDVDGSLTMEVEERTPIVRIIHSNGLSNYLDDDGNYMPLSRNFTAHVLVVTGFINESDFRGGMSVQRFNATLMDDMLIDEVYTLASFIESDPFWKAQIQQVYISKSGEFELTPRMGDHRILLGSIDHLERKLKKLKVFYKQGLSNTGWNQFETINLKFKNQIVCS